MSEARAKAEARKKKILERGSDRMAIATGQKVTEWSGDDCMVIVNDIVGVGGHEVCVMEEEESHVISVSTGKHLLKLLKFVGLTNSMHLCHTVKFRLYETKFG